jgi:hypothetical protein
VFVPSLEQRHRDRETILSDYRKTIEHGFAGAETRES